MTKINATSKTVVFLFWLAKLCYLFLIFAFCNLTSLQAQKIKKYPAQPIFCPMGHGDSNTRIGIPKVTGAGHQRALKAIPTANFEITFGAGAEANPEAKAAFLFALDIWAHEIISEVPIKIFADFTPLGAGVLASAGPSFLLSDFANAPEQGVRYPPALANALAGEILDPDEEFDLFVNLGSSVPWYFGTDGNTPSGAFDFVTIALHEICHGLGFSTVRTYDPTSGTASLQPNGNPSIFSKFMVDGNGNPLLAMDNNSVALGNAFTGGELFANGTFAAAALGGNLPELYAPSNFSGGSSLAHWDETAFPAGDPNSLMTPQSGTAESNFDIGAITRGYLKDMGWKLNVDNTIPITVMPSSFSEVIPINASRNREIMMTNNSENKIVVTLETISENPIVSFPSTTMVTIPAGETTAIALDFSTQNLSRGNYESMILIRSEDIPNPIEIPIVLRVLDGTEKPIIAIDPTTFAETIPQFATLIQPLTIANNGDANLSYTIRAEAVDRPNQTLDVASFLSISPSSGTIPLGASTEVVVKFDTNTLEPGTYEAAIHVTSSDTQTPLLVIPVSLIVKTPPILRVTPTELNASVDVGLENPPIQTQILTLSNTGDTPLEYTLTQEKTTVFKPILENTNTSPESTLDLAQYGLGNLNPVSEEKSKAWTSGVSQNWDLIKTSSFTDSIAYDSGILFPDSFSGLRTAAYTSAVKFDVENDFTLTAIRNGFRTGTLSNPRILLEIYRGGMTPADGELVHTQVMAHASVAGAMITETLDQPLSFTSGEYFWVVHKYPENIELPQGVDDTATQRPNTYFFSGNGGQTYTPSSFVFLVRAMSVSTQNKAYIDLEPSTGFIASGATEEVRVSFDGSDLENGNYNTALVIASNDPITPEIRISTNFEVSGQTSVIEIPEPLLLFDNVFVGANLQKNIAITNTGISPLVITDIVSDNSDFVIPEHTLVIPSGRTQTVPLIFAPSSLGNINGLITISSDAANASSTTVIVNGVGVAPPKAVLVPDTVVASTASNTTTTATINLRNDGTAPLTYAFSNLDPNPVSNANNSTQNTLSGVDHAISNSIQDVFEGWSATASLGKDLIYGYSWIDSDEEGGPVYDFVDISTVGKPITEGMDGDGSLAVDLPFDFDFYGRFYDRVYVNANGFLAFQPTTGTTYINSTVPLDDGNNNIIAALWTDLEPQNFGGAIYTATFEDRLIVQWSDVSLYLGNENETVTFQVVLRADGNIDIFYAQVDGASFLDTVTVGIENADATDGAQVAFNTKYIKDGLALRFVKPSQPITHFITHVNPISGAVAAGDTSELLVLLDANGLNDGVYYDRLEVLSNAPDKSSSTALFTLKVIGQPQIELSPSVLTFDPLFIGATSEASFTIKNVGTKTLELTDILRDNEDANYSFEVELPLALLPGRSKEIIVRFEPSKAGKISEQLVLINTDALGQDRAGVLLDGAGIAPPVISVAPEVIDLTINRGEIRTPIISIDNIGVADLSYAFIAPQFDAAENYQENPPALVNTIVGPDNFGYTCTDNNSGGPRYAYEDISTTGTLLDVGADGHQTIPLPFEFDYYGQPYNELTIGANGFLTFAPILGNTYTHLEIPDPRAPDLFIAPLWSDLEPQNGTGIFYQAHEDYLIVQYENIPGYSFETVPPDPVSFQVILYKGGTFKMQYADVDSVLRNTCTVGIEGPMGATGLQLAYNSDFLANGLAITFRPPIMGNLVSGETDTIPITLNASTLEGGQTYSSKALIYSNDPLQPETVIPIRVRVLEVPEITGFSLFNTTTNQEIQMIQNQTVIDLNDLDATGLTIVANQGAKAIGSVVFDFNDNLGYRTENNPPYALGGDYSGDFTSLVLPIGRYQITAKPYSGANGSGTLGIPLTVDFELIDSSLPAVIGFALVNADTNEIIGPLENGMVLDIDELGTTNFNVIAHTNANELGSVVFDFNQFQAYRTEMIAPYALGGNSGSNYRPLQFPLGRNTLAATAFTRSPRRKGTSYEIYFDVTQTAFKPQVKTSYQIYPNPVKDVANFSIQNAKNHNLEISVFNLLGRQILKKKTYPIDHHGHGQIDLSYLQSGGYILRILDAQNQTELETLIIKE